MIGIIANPLSGKDIRRVVAQGVAISNHEKINTLRRILNGIAALGVKDVRFMPDHADLVLRAVDGLTLDCAVQPIDLIVTGTAEDTTRSAALLAKHGAACVVVLGGDGTCRAVAKGAGDLPILPVSTGTNNAFPQMIEGTLAGMAAAVVARGFAAEAITRQPCLRVLRDGEPIDLALIDVVSYEGSTGARAVWQMEHVRQVITTRTTPGTIGLSAIAGYAGFKPPAREVGLALSLGSSGHTVLAPVAPGAIQQVGVQQPRWLRDAEKIRVDPVPCVLALDGERELHVRHDMLIEVQFDRHGPYVVDAQQALQLGAERGAFLVN